VVIKNGKLIGYNIHTIAGRGKDTFTYRHPFGSAIGISKESKADVVWTFTDSSEKNVYETQWSRAPVKDSLKELSSSYVKSLKYSSSPGPFNGNIKQKGFRNVFHKWKIQTAIGGGPVLLQNGEIKIANEEELKFTGKAIDDKHPRTAMGIQKMVT